MSDLVMTHRRFVTYSGTQPKFNIEVTVTRGTNTAAGVIPRNVLVKTLGTTDTFARIATLADLGVLRSVREEAVAAGDTEYRSSVITLQFDDVDTATAAVPVLRDRVDTLVKTWNTYYVDFVQGTNLPLTYDLPLSLTALTEQEELTLAYQTARDARAAEEAAQATLQDEFEALQITTANLVLVKEAHCFYKDSLVPIQALTPELTSEVASALASLDTAAAAIQSSSKVDYTGVVASGTSSSVTTDGALGGLGSYASLVGSVVVVRGSSTQAFVITGSTTNTVLDISPNTFSPVPVAANTLEIRSLTNVMGVVDGGATAVAASRLREYQAKLASSAGLVNSLLTVTNSAIGECATYTGQVTTSETSEARKLDELDTQRNIVLQSQQTEQTTLSELNNKCPSVDIDTL